MLGSANAWTPDANKLAALTGRGAPNLIDPAYATAITIDPDAGIFQQITMTGNATLTPLTVGIPGQELSIEIAASGGTRTATFGTGFRSTGTAAPTTGTSIVVDFISNGVSWLERARSASALS